MLDPEDWSGTSIGSIPIGQGVAVTPMQLLAAYNVIANDGVYVEPRLVAGTVDGDGTYTEADPSATHRVVSEQTAHEVRDMLVAVVHEGTGTNAAIDGYVVAGKTGTARKPQPTGTYRDAAGNFHYVSTFVGFVPAQDPQISITVVVDEPARGYYASQVSAPVFAELARFALRQFRVPPPATPYRSTVPAPVALEEGLDAAAPTEPVNPSTTSSSTTATTEP
jgi:cell division protein FtsI (penicillin-binding protein 3)